jgi:hypothetical protein
MTVGYVYYKNNTFLLWFAFPTVTPVRDHSLGVTAMLITYIVLAITGLLGTVIARDDLKAATHD